MKTKAIFGFMLIIASMLSIATPVYAGPPPNFGTYVRTLAKAGIPDVIDQLGLDFGAIFVSPTAPTPLDISQHEHTGGATYIQNWVASADIDGDDHPDYAAQWFKSKTWMVAEHDYVIIWSKVPILGVPFDQSLDFDLQWVKDLHNPNVPIADHGIYYGYFFDVTA